MEHFLEIIGGLSFLGGFILIIFTAYDMGKEKGKEEYEEKLKRRNK